MTYHDHNDRQFFRNLRKGAPAAVDAFQALDKAVFENPDNVIPLKYTELIAVAVALTTQCPYCIEAHSNAAREAGATEQELAETIMTATALRAGGGLTHGWQALKFFQGEAAASNPSVPAASLS
ncbi:carboxymuconolactone decarboxylase family protein [Arthrobacter sp. SLBN-122]|jgi:AhpD family alkylhydroperoxidase|uniref:carboxymuconolactone decarboxylase family protein n=1 Tax=Arthrobacter sp. SLBN-122 TaxID=2768455 RepID=UPI001151CB6F|nr:carboxymuconolactone decarboxylase family protein [Arthrobacter sp. SLBN-122]TQJ34207.1 AhpD family alkylhydroperoxidase [Arthrobacter sp. SLBN-122]